MSGDSVEDTDGKATAQPRGSRRPPRSLKGAKPKHPLWPEIYERLVSHWSPPTIERDLRRRYAEQIEEGVLDVPSTRTIERWRAQYLTEKDLLPPRLIDEALQRLPLMVDVYRELAMLVPLLANRVVAGRELEQKLENILIAGVDKAAQTFREHIHELWLVGQSLGVYPESAPPPPMFNIGQLRVGGRDSVRLEDLTDDDWGKFLDAEYRLETGREPPRFDEEPAAGALEGPSSGTPSDEA